eukprot:750386-Hanusia_phi.AAC.8
MRDIQAFQGQTELGYVLEPSRRQRLTPRQVENFQPCASSHEHSQSDVIEQRDVAEVNIFKAGAVSRDRLYSFGGDVGQHHALQADELRTFRREHDERAI